MSKLDEAIGKVLGKKKPIEELDPTAYYAGGTQVSGLSEALHSDLTQVFDPEITRYRALRADIHRLDQDIEDLQRDRRASAAAHVLITDPLVTRWMDQAEPYPLKRPEDVIAERMATMAMLFAADVHYRGPGDDRNAPSYERSRDIAKAALRAPMYLWTDEIFETAIASGLPQHVVSATSLPHPMWWTGKSKRASAHAYNNDLSLIGQFLVPHPDHMQVFEFWVGLEQVERTQLYVEEGVMPWGSRYPTDFDIEGKPGATIILQQLAFLASPYTGYDLEQVSRPIRRDMARRKKAEPPRVRFVTLRRPQPKAARSDGEVHQREWSRQWLVRGHYRAQWYRSLQAHKVIWIAPFMKGPVDKPFVPPVYKVAR